MPQLIFVVSDIHPNSKFFSPGAPRNATLARVDRLTSVTTPSKRASAGLISLLALSPAMVAFPFRVSLAAMASVLALASVA